MTYPTSTPIDGSVEKRYEYLLEIAEKTGLRDKSGENILYNRLKKANATKKDTVLHSYLTSNIGANSQYSGGAAIYPFGFNISQDTAVRRALSNKISIIEGPPGTGKTQTILNIIANVVMRGQSVAVISGNNSATANVFEKLQKYGVDFIAACLGNTENKNAFIAGQSPLPNTSKWGLSDMEKYRCDIHIKELSNGLFELLDLQNRLSAQEREYDALDIEYKHFTEYYENKGAEQIPYTAAPSSDGAANIWLFCEDLEKTPGFFGRLKYRFKYGIRDKKFYNIAPEILTAYFQKAYYEARRSELKESIDEIKGRLTDINFAAQMKEYSKLSAVMFKNYLSERYGKRARRIYASDELWRFDVTKEFILDYPVILATTYSLRSSLSNNTVYDYVIIDESSQVDIVTGALALSCAKRAVIVGDMKQLPNVVTKEIAEITDGLFKKHNMPKNLRYKDNSLLSSFIKTFPKAPRTLLREHYRCHPKIIEFCNKKFYDGELIILSEPKSDRAPLVIYKTAEGNHARDHVNRRQIEVIKNEVIPEQGLDPIKTSIGIVTPYRNQTSALQKEFSGTAIKADTVDKFQGRENDVIILSTVDNEVGEFADNANRLNVAVSRAIEQLIVVASPTDCERDTNLGDLVRYVKYNNMEVIDSAIYSVFDYLYKSYNEKRNVLLAKKGRISDYESENLIGLLIADIIKKEPYNKFSVACHVSLGVLLRDTDMLTKEQARYAQNPRTHVDFLIFDKIGNRARLAVEVDGISFHKDGSRQHERDEMKNEILKKYGLPLIRLRTDGSEERKRLTEEINKLV